MDKRISPNKPVALDPFNHLLSVDLDENTPLIDVFSQGGNETFSETELKKQVKKVRFSDDCSQEEMESVEKEQSDGKSHLKKVKSILKNRNYDKKNVENNCNLSNNEQNVCFTDSNNSESISKSDVPELSREQLNENLLPVPDNSSILKADYLKSADCDALDPNEIFSVKTENAVNMNETKGDFDNDVMDTQGIQETDPNSENLGEITERELTQKLENLLLHQKEEKFNDDVKIELIHTETDVNDNQDLVDQVKNFSKDLFLETVNRLRNDRIRKQCADKKYVGTLPNKKVFSVDNNEELQKKVVSEFNAESSTNLEHFEKVTIPNVPNTPLQSFSSKSRKTRPLSPLTLRMKDILKENASYSATGKELRSIVYTAWCTAKSEDKKALERKNKVLARESKISVLKEKALKEAASQKAFMYWKEQKEKIIKMKKAEEIKLAQSKLLKAQQDRRNQKETTDLVFRVWKQRKDQQLKEQLQKQRLSVWNEKKYRKRAEEMKEEDAEAAFSAWKSQKLMEIEEKHQMLQMKEEEELQKAEERAQRDIEALEAYDRWLEYKEQDEDDWRRQLIVCRPPWSPPGKVS